MFPSFRRSLPSQSANSQSVQSPVVGRAIHLSFKTKNHSFFSLLTFHLQLLLFPIQTTSLHPLCVVGCLNGSLFLHRLFLLGFISYVRVLFSQVFFGLPRIREYRPGRFPSHVFVSPVAAPLPNISSLSCIQPARGCFEKPKGRKRSQ